MRCPKWLFRCFREGGNQHGQSIILVMVGVFTLLAFVGLAVDLGVYYSERVRIVRAVDAAALAAAPELPLESAAHARAREFLRDNGYNDGNPRTRLEINGSHVQGPPEDQADTIIILDTASFRDLSLPPAQQPNTADRIRVRVRQRVPVIFMRFLGFDSLWVSASATAENIKNLDIVIVFDRSGSMEFDTLCYGCWQAQSGIPYPGGLIYPLPWNGPPNGPPAHCGATTVFTYALGSQQYNYYYIEAEEYSRASNPYNRYLYVPYYTYWVMQREAGDGASGRDSRGAYIMHMPYSDHETQATFSPGYGVTCRLDAVVNNGQCAASGYTQCYCKMDVPGGPFPAPRVDYDFTVLRTGNYYIWVRGQAQSSWRHPQNLDLRIFWNVNSSPITYTPEFSRGVSYNGADPNFWRWRRLNDTPIYLTAGSQHTLRIWAGGAGFALDRIVITNDPSTSVNTNIERTGVFSNGRTDWACNPCDARFGGYPGGCGQSTCAYSPNCNSGPNPDRRKDDIYDDEQPIRAAIEAAKRFVGMLDYRYDQIGYVSYSDSATIDSPLECLRRRGVANCNPSVITNTVVAALNATQAAGSTNIADGILKGIDVLSTRSGQYGRPGAAHIMILMTDGRPNQVPNSTCYTYNLIQKYGLSVPSREEERRGKECTLYYAEQARNNNIVIYTITLGDSADFELMETVANITGGVHRNADRPEKLNQIFDELYERIFLRLVE
ncbi:MAG: VWA domain-containing protein [Anaerolineae bacterium]|nr:VWA domain-containing protein [Anaerolineae bacterium]MDW8067342.1 VWA domain-containing protein [Anaerolineae bacterium]